MKSRLPGNVVLRINGQIGENLFIQSRVVGTDRRWKRVRQGSDVFSIQTRVGEVRRDNRTGDEVPPKD